MPSLSVVTGLQSRILRALGRYQYLTRSQLAGLGTGGASGLYAGLRDLAGRKRPLIARRDLGVIPRGGRLPHLYFLTPRGARLLAEMQDRPLSAIRHPKKAVMFTHDFHHRVATVDCHIALGRWARASGAALEFVETYFAGQRAIPDAMTGERLIPDMTAMVRDRAGAGDDGRFLLCFEIYNQTRTTRVVQQLEKHRRALLTGALNDAYEFTRRSYRLLCVFDTRRNMELVMNRLRKTPDFRDVAPALFFKALPDMMEDFAGGWEKLHEPPGTPLPGVGAAKPPGVSSESPPS